jgi:hypothetical protein
VTYDLPNPFLFLSVGGNAAPVCLPSLPSGESDPAVTLDCAGAAPAYPCCPGCGLREPCDRHCPVAKRAEQQNPTFAAENQQPRFQLDEAALMSEIEPVPAFISRKVCELCGFAVIPEEAADHCSYRDCPHDPTRQPANPASDIEAMLELARAEDWPAPPRRMVG